MNKMKLTKSFAFLLAFLLSVACIIAPANAVTELHYLDSQSYSAPLPSEYYSGSYYNSLNTSQTGNAFRRELATLITSTHKHQTTYNELLTVFKTADADPNNRNNILWFYSGTSVSKSAGSTNREHVWPKNAGKAFPEKSKAGSDAHHLRPTDSKLNSTRSSMSFDEVKNGRIVAENGSTSYKNLCYTNGTFFYPGEGYRGATARILMYVQVRWGDEFDLTFVDSAGNNKTIGKISTLMKWHIEEPPTEAEIRRNEEVFKIQGNRNPFIDHPEFAEMIYCNDGKSYNTALKNVVTQYGSYLESKDIESISLPMSSTTLVKGSTYTLIPTVTPVGANSGIKWTSSDTHVATVNNNGVVTANNDGSVTITATSEKDPSVKASLEMKVISIVSLSVSGTPKKTVYKAGEKFDPTGLTVRAVYSDNTEVSLPLSSCKWLDGVKNTEALAQGTTEVICSAGGYHKTVGGITVEKAPVVSGGSFKVTRSSFGGSGPYAWTQFTSGQFSGMAYMYSGNQNSIQMNSSKTSKYIYNTTPVLGISSITVKLTSDSGSKNFKILTSSTPFGQVSGVPSTGTSAGTKSVSSSGATWTFDTDDRYFAICYESTGAVYIESIEVKYGVKQEETSTTEYTSTTEAQTTTEYTTTTETSALDTSTVGTDTVTTTVMSATAENDTSTTDTTHSVTVSDSTSAGSEVADGTTAENGSQTTGGCTSVVGSGMLMLTAITALSGAALKKKKH